MASRISLDRIHAARTLIDPVFLNSPQYECESLNSFLGTRLTLKIETCNPIRSFKGRGAEFLLASTHENRLMCASAGNFGQAMAYACRKRNVKLTVYAATTANPFKVERMRALGASIFQVGEDFDAAKEAARKEAVRSGVPMIEDGLALETIEGAGTMAVELLERTKPDVVLVPLGNGALFNGVATVFKALAPNTRLIAVQAKGAPAMLDSWKANKLIVHDTISTIADGIGVRIPIPQALDDMRSLIDDGITVAEDSIVEGMRLLHNHAGLVAEPSAAVGIAAILENSEMFRDARVTTIICGGNITESQRVQWLR